MRFKVLLVSVVLFSSCSSVNRLRTFEQSEKLPPTSPKTIRIYSTDKVEKEYSIIGQVVAAADAGTNSTRPVNLLKKEAAAMGADAIINLKLQIIPGYWINGIKASGTAVKFKNN